MLKAEFLGNDEHSNENKEYIKNEYEFLTDEVSLKNTENV